MKTFNYTNFLREELDENFFLSMSIHNMEIFICPYYFFSAEEIQDVDFTYCAGGEL